MMKQSIKTQQHSIATQHKQQQTIVSTTDKPFFLTFNSINKWQPQVM